MDVGLIFVVLHYLMQLLRTGRSFYIFILLGYIFLHIQDHNGGEDGGLKHIARVSRFSIFLLERYLLTVDSFFIFQLLGSARKNVRF